ncbi:ATP-binding domain-containing protein [Chondromyces crocatus]|uniref:DNA 3'-5' helicase II n=1 Tax=Chondromyces crocatus TaxID=52 RepID=A0A0K1ECF0_CHOCO|nr:ATP-binding domain-containing protein [Chondromyces crocatus]AKT38243.1 uncharacterized protein CMC5_023860 [Chondromyces crocatus]
MDETWWAGLKELDDAQKDIIGLPLDASVLMTGPPGSGKSNLLLLRAKRLTLSGCHDYQVIVFTRALQDFLRSGVNQYGVPTDRVQTSWGWALKLLREYDVQPRLEGDFDSQRRALLHEIKELTARRRIAKLFNTILLDEAQDYLPEEIEIFGSLAKHLSVAADSRQKIYGGTESLQLIRGAVDHAVALEHHYRNGIAICRTADALASVYSDHLPLVATSNYNETLFPSSVSILECKSLEAQCTDAISRIQTQLRAYPHAVVGVLCALRADADAVFGHFNSSPLRGQIFKGSEKDTLFGVGSRRVYIGTIHSAKGLEFRAVHLMAAENIAKMGRHSRHLAYVAVTRARTSLNAYHTKPMSSFLQAALAEGGLPIAIAPVDDSLFGGTQ